MLTPARREASTSVATSASFGWGVRSAGPSLRRTPSSRRTSFRASRAVALSAANSLFAPSLRSSQPVGGRLGLDGDQRHVVGDDVVHLAGDAGALLEQRSPGFVELASGDLLGERVARSAGDDRCVEGELDREKRKRGEQRPLQPAHERPDRQQVQEAHRPGRGAAVAEAGDRVADEDGDRQREPDRVVVADE